LSISGTVIRASTVKMLEFEREFLCLKCKHTFMVEADFEQGYALAPPTRCPSEGGSPCDSSKFKCTQDAAANPTACRDYQEIKVQEQISKLAVGTIPRSIWVILENDLVDGCKAGDDVVVCGTVLQRWQPLRQESRCDLETVIKGNHVRVKNAQGGGAGVTDEAKKEFEEFWGFHTANPLAGRDQILASMCPQVFGLYVVKLTVLTVLIGGVPRVDQSGTRIRGESHMLLVGDPGTGKSQFLKYAAKLIPRSVITTGIGSTSAGLTVTAVKDGGHWTLEAGALVLADGGLCCIDEFSGIREHDRGSIHEAMEQQTLSVAKAGLVCKLNTRTTVLAATNPKGKYDPEETLSANTALASPLLSRFDVVLVLLDTQNDDWDTIVSSFILDRKDHPSLKDKPDRVLWSLEKLQQYIAHVKTIDPVLSADSEIILSKYYQMQRQTDTRQAARTTIRLLESLVRLAQAHARLMFRSTVTLQDAIVAVSMVEASMQGAALVTPSSPLHSAFPKDADADYLELEQRMLDKLGLKKPDQPEPVSVGANDPAQMDGGTDDHAPSSEEWLPTPASTHPGHCTAVYTEQPAAKATQGDAASNTRAAVHPAPSPDRAPTPSSARASAARLRPAQVSQPRVSQPSVAESMGVDQEPSGVVVSNAESMRTMSGQRGAEPGGVAASSAQSERSFAQGTKNPRATPTTILDDDDDDSDDDLPIDLVRNGIPSTAGARAAATGTSQPEIARARKRKTFGS